MMLVHFPLLAAASAAMFAAAFLFDLLRPLVIREAGTQPLRWPLAAGPALYSVALT